MRDKISIIVPVYKVENEIDRCVQSLLHQTYKNIEIILVDDGSPDRCPQICDSYAETDNRIYVVHKKNGGLSDARNVGLRVATGNYVLYVDSDDYIDFDSCERFIKVTNNCAVDIVVGNAIRESPNGNELMVHKSVPYNEVCDPKDFIKSAISTGEWYAPAWLNMYRREFLVSNNLFFKVGIYFEDVQMLPRAFLAAKRVSIMEGTFYHYIIREDSIMTSTKNEKKKNDSFKILREWKDIFDEVQDKSLQEKLYGMLVKCFLHECRIYDVTDKSIIGCTSDFLLRYGLNFKEKVKALLFVLFPKIYLKL